MGYYCNLCKKTITESEYKYSMKNLGKPLCYGCQKKQQTKTQSVIPKIQPVYQKPI
jgi:hypothetical protein